MDKGILVLKQRIVYVIILSVIAIIIAALEKLNNRKKQRYIAFTPENAQDDSWTLHILTQESDTPKEICNINTRNIYLVDDKWVYFSDYGNTIYRIFPSGENLQKVM